MKIKIVTNQNHSPSDLASCAKILSEAFQNEPGLNWLCPRELHYLWFYETAKLILSSQLSELIFTKSREELMACALVTPPQFKPNFIAQIIWLWRVGSKCGWRVILKTFQYLSKAERKKKPNDFCIEFIGVSLRFRGQGLV